MTKQTIVGMMSGTSLDGIDAVLVDFYPNAKLELISTQFTPYPDLLKSEIAKISLSNKGVIKPESYFELESQLNHLYSKAALDLIDKTRHDKPSFTQQVTAIANHGQTIRHSPDTNPAYSLQLGDGQEIANLTNIKTLTQFRQADMQAGGQGAPLMPAFHNAFFANQGKNIAVVNVGGIANITILNNTSKHVEVIGYDTGPANTLLDQWIYKHHQQSYDNGGRWAQQGTIQKKLVERLLQDPYFKANAPKSTGTEYFNLNWLSTSINNLDTFKAEDVQASLLDLTCQSIANEIIKHDCNAAYVCGGGAQNKALMSLLSKKLSKEVNGIELNTTQALGIAPDWVEAVGFAWLGYCKLNRIPSNLPSVTGASKSVVLGKSFTPQV